MSSPKIVPSFGLLVLFSMFGRISAVDIGANARLVDGNSKPSEGIKLLRAEMEANVRRLEALEYRLNQSITLQAPQSQATSGSSFLDIEVLAMLQRQLDNITDALFTDFQRRVELRFTDVRNDVKRLEEKTSRWLQESGAEYADEVARLNKEVERLADTHEALASTPPFHCESGYVTSNALISTLSHSKFVPFSTLSASSSTTAPDSTFTAPPTVIVGARYAGVWPAASSTPMRPRGGGGFTGSRWFSNNAGLANWFGASGVLSRENAGTTDDSKAAINFGVWIEGRPSKDGFIVAFQTGNPNKDARISANWMACGY